MGFSLEKFESYAYSRDLEMGMRELKGLLEGLEANYGHLGAEFRSQPLKSVEQQDIEQHILTRAAAAVSCLLSDKTLAVAPEYQQHILTMHRWLSALFAATPFNNADHVMRALNLNEDKDDLHQLELATDDLLKFCLLYMPDSEVPIDLDALLGANKVLALSLCLVLISPRFLGSPLAHSKREQILPWLTANIELIQDVEQLPIGVLHDLYMHCSYADRPDKHDIKRPISKLLKKKLDENQLFDSIGEPQILQKDSQGKPVMLVVLEWFGSSHSIYRTHSRTIEAARRHFHVIGMAYSHCVDDVTKQVFDEFVQIENVSILDQLRQIQQQSTLSNAQICYMPSLGMFPLTMWLANLRVAPLQLMALGHPATSHGCAIDYVVVEEDYVGSESCFSEKLLKLPKDGMPYRPSASAVSTLKPRIAYENPEVVKIVVCATTMKLNPGFLHACSQIIERARVPIEFRFLVGQAQGLLFPNVQRVVKMFLGDRATVYPHQGYADYMRVISECDMFINPFPFGNTNGIIDTVSAGLVGVCRTGPEVHEHIDQGLFERFGFPEWLVAKNTDEYIGAAIRLAENGAERVALSERFSGPGTADLIFNGRPEILGDLFLKCLEKIAVVKELGTKSDVTH